jgi:hypothetical protein
MDLVKAMVMVWMVEAWLVNWAVPAAALPAKSRETAEECSPRRKPWVKSSEMHSPEGADETQQACDTDGGQNSLSPRWGSVLFHPEPTACAVGYIPCAASRLAEQADEILPAE